MNRVIFLDIDGVLNSARFRADSTNGEGVVIVNGAFDATAHIDPQRVARLNRLIDATKAEVVLSSSWRKLFGLERTQASLQAKGFAHRIADRTVRLVGEARRVEIESYLAAPGTRPQFVILDDDAEEIGAGFGPNFVHVPDGLEDDHVERACRILLGVDPVERPRSPMCDDGGERMAEVSVTATAWLQSVLHRLPAAIRAVYVEYGDAFTPGMEHLVCFNAFGFESLAGGRFDPANPRHVGELGEFTWEPSDECRFRAADHPDTDWLAVLRAAAGSPEVVAIAAVRGVRLIIGEHDGEVFVVA